MKTYHKFFVFLKFLIVLMFVLSKLHINNFSHKLEKMVENIFAIYVGVVVIFMCHVGCPRATQHEGMLLELRPAPLTLFNCSINVWIWYML